MIKNMPLLVGAERSGTTLLRLMLKGHPQITWQREFEFSVDMIQDNGAFPSMESFYEFLSTNRVFLGDAFKIDKALSFPELINSFVEQTRERDKRPIIGATCHRHFDRLLHVWPDAKCIHLVRDGRDVARSTVQLGMAGNLWTGTQRWIDAELVWDRMKRKLPEEQRLEIRYEDLILYPEDNLRRICTFIGVEYDPQMEHFYEGTTYDKPDPKLIYQWKKKQSKEDLQLIEARIGDMLVDRGYELSGHPTITVGALKQKQLQWQDRWYRRKVGVKAFGWRISIIGFLARRLGMKNLANKIQLEMNEISNTLLK